MYQIAFYTSRAPDKQSPNEDCAGWINLGDGHQVFMVADGLGGLPAGNEISVLAVETILQSLSMEGRNGDLRASIMAGIDRANASILATATGGATTLVLLETEDHAIRPYHIGDSMILVTGQKGRIKYQSVPHSPTGYAVEAGLIGELEAMQHEQRHLVSNVLGSHDMRLEIGPRIVLSRYDTVLLASDGLADNLQLDLIIELIRKGRLEQCLARMTKLCRERMSVNQSQQETGHPDDLTILLLRRQG